MSRYRRKRTFKRLYAALAALAAAALALAGAAAVGKVGLKEHVPYGPALALAAVVGSMCSLAPI